MEKESEKKNCVNCIGCQYEYEKTSALGTMCPQFHFICTANGCEKNFLEGEMVLNQDQIKCPVCFVELDLEPIMTKLDCRQLAQLMKSLSKRQGGLSKTLNKGEELMFCSFCEYFEICDEKVLESMVFFQCKRFGCERIICLGCRKEVKTTDYGIRNIDDPNYILFDSKGNEIDRFLEHCNCVKLKKVKEDIEKAIDRAMTVSCPSCGLAGRKDENCTHMMCPRCKSTYCYICGVAEEKVDAAGGLGQRLYRHNMDWQQNEKRCPMYFLQIAEIDERWPKNSDEECLDYFHAARLRINLRELLKKYYLDKQINLLRQAEKQFALFKKAGVDFDYLYTNSQKPLIRRQKRKI